MAFFYGRPDYRLLPIRYRYPRQEGFSSLSRNMEEMVQEMLAPFDHLHQRVGELERQISRDPDEGNKPLGYAGGHLAEAFRDPSKFKVRLDLSQFNPNDIRVELEKNKLHVHAEHSEQNDDGYGMFRRFNQYYTLPEGVNLDKIESILHSDGYLTLEAPIDTPPAEKKPTPISIKRVETPAVASTDEAEKTEKS